ncbi:phage integrase family protein [Paraburkholderia sp. BL27I4N3]|uniref:tyrosine-type recombinase/integrase n=1 Tax=Paraburkholderia sp. BL27I4N3 TaxID=1938805 RepID=UPI000E23E7E7|nr:tyrosine-type recombinase/integrase [Paraburkholderia sp. BL27I4N3]REE20711.1 phage integrase family protein [Paraburkholderia sp. BL27I4N3]
MGRRPTKNLNLPPGMRARKQRSGTVYYYFDLGGLPRRELPLGPDFVEAVRKWSELEAQAQTRHQELVTFRYAAERYVRQVLPTKSRRTQRDNLLELDNLYKFFDDPPVPLGEMRPVHVAQYLAWRSDLAKRWYVERGRPVPARPGHVRGNREIALLSHIFNFSREHGLTDAVNPCVGVRRNKEVGRTVYIEDDLFSKVWEAADVPTRDAMDLAYLTGQRPADTLKFAESDIRRGELWIEQGKRGKKLRIQVSGELAAVIDRIRVRKSTYASQVDALIVNEAGERLLPDALRFRFDRARVAAKVEKDLFQFRDLRAKAGTDKAESAGDIRAAQLQLGHRSLQMTEHYVRERKGDKVEPTR